MSKHNVFVTVGASNHSQVDRQQDDYYATEPKATQLLLKHEKFNKHIWECCCEGGHMSNVLILNGYTVKSSDITDRGYGEVYDFLQATKFDGDIITNPPYKNALEIVEKALDVVSNGNKVAMFLRIQFLEGKKRRKLFDTNPPKTVYVSSERLICAKDGDFESVKGSAVAYAWFVWEKGYRGETILKWL